jgi:hypothetical protein
MATPVWITPPGFVGTFTEGVSNSVTFAAVGAMDFNIITGTTPPGLVTYVINTSTSADYVATVVVSGTPYHAGIDSRYQFVIRANNASGVTDRTFYADILGASAPIWLTPSGFLKTGISSQYYSINGQFVDYQLSAEYDVLPPGQKLRYYIEDFDGILPPGLQLGQDGRITGHILDQLKLSYKASLQGAYDSEPYDIFPYDHVVISTNTTGAVAKFISKTYQFRVSVTDGISTSKQLFKIRVEDPSSLRVDDTFILSDTDQYLTDAGYLLSPQWLTPTNLGYIRANNNQIISLHTYDFAPGLGPVSYHIDVEDMWEPSTEYKINQAVMYLGKTYLCKQSHTSSYSFDEAKWAVNILPPYFKLDSTSGILYASLPYQPAYSISYTFTIFVKKVDSQTGNYTYSSRKFSLTVKGDVETTIQFVSNTYLGALTLGHQSELAVVAKHVGTGYSIKYQIVDGVLPKGLSLSIDGNIIGSAAYDALTNFYWNTDTYSGSESFSNNSLLSIDGGSTTFDKNYHFTVLASDIYDQSAVEKDFYLTVGADSIVRYTKIYAEPLLKLDQRELYNTFINDPYVFDTSLIYRNSDPAFGIQQKIQLYFEHGIEQIKLDIYSDAIRKYFYRKRFFFGNVKYSKANDADGNHVYDIVYVEIIDGLENSPVNGILGPRTVKGQTVYPNSTINMRNQLQTIKINGNDIHLDEYLMPRFMRTIQPDTGSPLGFILAVPLCYALPGSGATIVNRINAVDFNFSAIDFKIDRLIVKDNLTNSGAKYLLFPRRDMMGQNLGEDLSILNGPEPVPLYTEDGNPLELEI